MSRGWSVPYPNLDAIKVTEENQISVLNDPYQTQILLIAKAVAEFKPTIIAVEANPTQQLKLDSLYREYVENRFALSRNEIFQLGFRLAKMLETDGVKCIDDMGTHYAHVEALFSDSARLSKLEAYHKILMDSLMKTGYYQEGKVHSLIDELIRLNQPEYIKEQLGFYLSALFCYEETEGDFLGC